MAASLVVLNGTIYTLDPELPLVDAVTIVGGRIAYRGDSQSARKRAGPHSEVLDLKGRMAVPGFADAHLHLLSYGLSLQQVDVGGTLSPQEAAERVRAHAADVPHGEWISGRGWDRNLWSPPDFPRRELLDAVTRAHPVALGSKDGHSLWANSRALQAAGILATTGDPPGGRIVRDSAGEPTGMLLENAMDAVYERMTRPGREALRRAARAAAEQALRRGLTSVHDCEGGEAFETLLELWHDRALPLRVYMLIPLDNLDAAIQLGLRSGFGDEWLRIGHLKLFADGSLGSRTADMLEPYAGEAANRGVSTLGGEALRAIVERASRAGIAVATHAIGDRANRRVLDVYAEMRSLWSAAGLRPRIEHAQLLAEADIPRLAQVGVVASMQPIHATADMEMAEAHWGARCRGAYAWRSLLAAGTVLAFGSDCPVETLDPLAGIHAAVTRQRADGTPAGGWRPEQSLTVQEAVRAYTWGAAYAAGEEGWRGSLAPGKVGDLTVLSEDIFAVPARALLDTRVVATICGGQIAYSQD